MEQSLKTHDTTLDDILESAANEQFDSDKEEQEYETEPNIVEVPDIPKEFAPLMIDFISDICTTFPEYKLIIAKWWGFDSYTNIQVLDLFAHCMSVYPSRFTDIIYKNNKMFEDTSTVNVDFLPGISFKYLWSCDGISEQTRTSIWKYLQAVVLCVVGTVEVDSMGEDMKNILDNIDENTFKDKLCDTVNNIQKIFEDSSQETEKDDTTPSSSSNTNTANMFQEQLDQLVGGKIGDLAKDLLGDTIGEINEADFENMENPTDIIKTLFKNEGGLKKMAESVSEKLHSKLESGEYNHSELLQEATGVLQNMKDMPGMDMIQKMMSGMMSESGTDGDSATGDLGSLAGVMSNLMGSSGGGRQRVDQNAMDRQTKRTNQITQMKQRIEKRKLQEAIAAQQMQNMIQQQHQEASQNIMTDEELIAMMEKDSTQQNTENLKSSSKKKKSKKK